MVGGPRHAGYLTETGNAGDDRVLRRLHCSRKFGLFFRKFRRVMVHLGEISHISGSDPRAAVHCKTALARRLSSSSATPASSSSSCRIWSRRLAKPLTRLLSTPPTSALHLSRPKNQAGLEETQESTFNDSASSFLVHSKADIDNNSDLMCGKDFKEFTSSVAMLV